MVFSLVGLDLPLIKLILVIKKAVFTVDFRHPEKSTLEAMKAQLKAGAEEIAKNIGLEIEIESVGGFDPVTFDSGCVESIRNAAD